MQTVYHASPYEYDFPNYEKLLEGLSKNGNHENGELGLWCSLQTDWINGFGGNIYKIEYNDSTQLLMDASEFAKRCHKRDVDYQEWRRELLSSGYQTLALKEKKGNIDMLIIIDFDAIKTFQKIM